MNEARRFVSGSTIARRIKLPATAILADTRVSSRELLTAKESGSYGPLPVDTGAVRL